MIESILEPFSGLHVLKPTPFFDKRGSFVKTFEENIFRQIGIKFNPVEEFYSSSSKDVIRGIHFQVPPKAHQKLVYCIKGRILDVIIDLRKSSPTFGEFFSHELTEQNREMIFIPIGFGHGFLSLEENSIMIYKTSCAYSPENDFGIHWNSIDFNWNIESPIVSERDNQFTSLIIIQNLMSN